ncbi:MAG: hypothetical protein IIW56_05955 [Oscillospiraceae bacterium]|nr:hypothetical protein [Oscillospiraceae bacterium]
MKKRFIAALLVIVTLVSLMCVSVSADGYPLFSLSTKLSTPSIVEGETGYLIFNHIPEFKDERYHVDFYNEEGRMVATLTHDPINTSTNIKKFKVSLPTDYLNMTPGRYTVEYYMEFYTQYEWHETPKRHRHTFFVVPNTCKGNHDFEETHVYTEATCETEGWSELTCSKCGYLINQVGYGHQNDEGVITKNPTPEEDGTILYTCQLCGVQTEEVYAKDHAAHITKQPKTVYANYGEEIEISLKAKGDGLKYQWYIKNEGGSKYSKSSVTGPTYFCTMTEKSQNRRVLCIVTDKYGNEVQSNTVVLRMNASIITQPKNTYTKSGSTAKVTVKAAGDDLTYEWYIKNAGQKKYTKSSVTKATYSCKMNEKSKDRYVYCIVTDKYGNSVKSKTVVLRMAATITTQPKDVSVEEGKSAKVTVKAVGDELTYTWYFKNEGSSKFSKSSITKATYSAKMSDKVDGRQVYCVVTDKYGKTVTSNTVTLSMK